MKKLVTLLATAASVFAASTSVYAAEVNLRMSQWLPSTFFAVPKVFNPWVKEVERVTEGRVKIEVLPKVVGSVPGQFDVAVDGLADITVVIPGYTPDRFPTTALAELPVLPVDGNKLGPAFEKVFREQLLPVGEFRGVHVLTIYPGGLLHFQTKGKEIKSPGDLAGLKFRSSGKTMTQTLTAFGATPILKNAAEAYEMLASGTIDGQVTLPSAVTGFNMLDLTDHTMVMEGGLGSPLTALVINQDKWDQISEKDQKAIMSISGSALAAKASMIYQQEETQALADMEAAGYKVTYGSLELIKELRAKTQHITDAWIKRAKEAGLKDPQAALDAYVKAAGIN